MVLEPYEFTLSEMDDKALTDVLLFIRWVMKNSPISSDMEPTIC